VTETNELTDAYYKANNKTALCEIVVKLKHDYNGLGTLKKSSIRKIQRKAIRACECPVVYIDGDLEGEGGHSYEIIASCDSIIIVPRGDKPTAILYDP